VPPRRVHLATGFVGFAGALALAVAGCADPPDQGADWQYLHATIIEPYCATSGCHSYAAAEFSTSRTGPIDLSTSDPDPSEHPAGSPAGCLALQDWVGVTNGKADLIRLLEGTYVGPGIPPAYTQMPADVPLTPAQIRTVKNWIDAGAPCN
jgi:hypothetical protein